MREQVDSDHHDHHGLRLRRSESWANKAAQFYEQDDHDCALLLYWIALNALYDVESSERGNTPPSRSPTDSRLRRQFLDKLQKLDLNRVLYDTVWRQYSDHTRNILGNRFMYTPFWIDQLLHVDSEHSWEIAMQRENRNAERALREPAETAKLIAITLDRVYVVRCQLAHGSATYKGSVNREQVHTCSHYLHALIPTIGSVFRSNPDADWGPAPYPPVDDS